MLGRVTEEPRPEDQPPEEPSAQEPTDDLHPPENDSRDEHSSTDDPPSGAPPHPALPPNWAELFKNMPKIAIPRMPIFDLPRFPKVDVPLVPKIDLARIDVSSALVEEFARIGEQARAMLASITAPIQPFKVPLPRIPAIPQHVADALKEFGRVTREAWERGMPRNWKDFEFEEIEATIARVRATGFSLAWVPRTVVLREVLDAPEEDTAEVLLAHREELIADLNECLAEITSERYTHEREAALAAVASFTNGHPEAAQALAASVFTSALHVAFEDRQIGRIGSKLAETDPEDAVISQLRLRTIYLAAKQALGEFHPATAEPERREFNRHNTAHRITPAQWTEANAVSALMLATSLLRELAFWDELGEAHATG